jgi:hypothetical protein
MRCCCHFVTRNYPQFTSYPSSYKYSIFIPGEKYIVWYVTQAMEIKVKVKFNLEQATKVRDGVDLQLYSFFNPGARLGGWSTSHSGRFYPQLSPGTHCIGAWMGPRAGLDGCGICRPNRNSIPRPSSP